MLKTSVRRAVVVALALATLSVSCSTATKADRPTGGPATASQETSASVSPSASSSAPREASVESAPTSAATQEPVSAVRDAFAGLQATLRDSCTPGNCAYFLGRVYEELHRMDRAMKADPKGAGHFTEPIDLIKKLDVKLDGDRSFENLEKHRASLISTREKINTWMQGHPDDYR
ncbi:hypothetical protein ADL22_16995 [Streptomyces sp. NRRL F-4489]|uniref:hypothetical protein n=1 Tax=Streptomyces sp. NRRL F-4489 TaxID=1609095 RepID=UPI000748194E|nr:hypothetical protein [Streptomyces sp. NRRL F-4489]KUL38936.1 hypothetical protein ADL22_16995 [Streptomyces sp. NRRL F-4489]